jgi:hypothetical protein
MERELAKTQALRRRQDRVDLGLVGARLVESEPHALGRADEPHAIAEGLHPALAAAGGELGHSGPLAVVEPQVVERWRLDQKVELARGAQYRQIGEELLDPSRGVPQLGLRVGIAAAPSSVPPWQRRFARRRRQRIAPRFPQDSRQQDAEPPGPFGEPSATRQLGECFH